MDIYRTLYDDMGNVAGYTNIRTGEFIENEHHEIDVRPGTRIILETPEDRERIAQQREQHTEQYDRTRARATTHFVWVNKFGTFDNLQPETSARFMQLCCYMDYNERGANLIRARRNITRKDVQSILNLSTVQTDRTLSSLSGYIEKTETEYTVIADGIIKGELQQDTHNSYTRINTASYKELYNGTDKSKHKYIGYMLSCLQYVNNRYNILCYNPDERELQSIEPISKSDFCGIIGYSYSNLKRLIDSFHTMKIQGVQAFCISGRGDNSYISINPELLYSGDMIATAKAHYRELAML